MTFQITAKISHIEYTPTICRDLETYTLSDIESGSALEDGTFIIQRDTGPLAVSRWVTPKRTRSYPYARVYDTLQYSNRATIIPIVKDEGAGGDRDYLQWDTVSLMSLLNVYVIPAYYVSATQNDEYENKITNQKLDEEYIAQKLRELEEYQSDALHWNMREMENIEAVAEECKENYYEKIPKTTGVEMSSVEAFERKIEKMTDEIEVFKEESRAISKSAQGAEASSDQPNEEVLHEKGEVTLTNFLGGKYHFTVDEVRVIDDTIVIIEKKHSSSSTLPSLNDIKDGLTKLIVYANITSALMDDETYNVVACLGLTSNELHGIYTPDSGNLDRSELKDLYKDRLADIFEESRNNEFITFASHTSISEDQQLDIIRRTLNKQ